MDISSAASSQVAASVDTVSPEFLAQRQRMKICHDLYTGAEGMRQAGEEYVERGDGESAKAYQTRLARPALLNSFKRTIEYMRGQVFQRNVSLGEDAGEAFEAWAEDVDHQGNNLTVWGAKTFESGLRDGVVFVLADYSRVQLRTAESGAVEWLDERDGQWKPKTQAADAEQGWSPYLVRVEAGDVLDVWTETQDGRDTITHFRYMEHGLEDSPLSEWSRQDVWRIHAWWQDRWQKYVKHGAGGQWELEAEGPNQLGIVPVTVFMPGEQSGPSTARPALADLADLNRRHWAASCGHCELMEYVRRPVWFGRAIGRIRNPDGTESDVVVGAGRMISAEDPQADLKSVGVDSAAVAASAQELESLKNEMAMYGLQLLQPKNGKQTATEVDRSASENNCTLAAWALKFQDCLENCLHDVARWWGMEDGPSVAVNNVFSRQAKDDYLLEMYRAGAVSLESYLTLLKQTGTLPDDFDIEAEADKAARGTMMNGASTGIASLASMLNGGRPKGQEPEEPKQNAPQEEQEA